MRAQLLIPAAGLGRRLGREEPKALVPVAGVPLLVRTLQRFEPAGLAVRPVIAAPPGWEARFEALISEHLPHCRPQVVTGGTERQDSVRLGLNAVSPEAELVAIHDAARPFIEPTTVIAVLDAAQEHGAATVAVPVVDTILVGDERGFLDATPERAHLWACQTPQVFRRGVIHDAHARASRDGLTFTDDATLVRHFGHPVKLVEGTASNRKITTPEDIAYAEFLLREHL